jgi:hypothetical protein
MAVLIRTKQRLNHKFAVEMSAQSLKGVSKRVDPFSEVKDCIVESLSVRETSVSSTLKVEQLVSTSRLRIFAVVLCLQFAMELENRNSIKHAFFLICIDALRRTRNRGAGITINCMAVYSRRQ